MPYVIDDISGRSSIYYMCTYKSLVNGAKTLETIFISDFQTHGQMLSMNRSDIFSNIAYIILNIKTQIEKIVLHLYKTIQ